MDMLERMGDLPVAPEELRVNVTSMVRTQLPITTIALAMGLNVRVGMEDNVTYRRGELLESNAQLVERRWADEVPSSVTGTTGAISGHELPDRVPPVEAGSEGRP